MVKLTRTVRTKKASVKRRRTPYSSPMTGVSSISRAMKGTPNTQVFTFTRKADFYAYAGGNSAVYGGYQFSLNSLLNYTEFTSLFESFKINSVNVKFYLMIDPGASAATNILQGYYPRLFTMIDEDDAAVPANITECREYGNVRTDVMMPTKPVSIWLKPKCASTTYATSLVSAYEVRKAAWLDCQANGPQVPHYGLKWGLEYIHTGQTMEVEITYNVSFRGLK